jgi:hypothetical protein
MAKKIFKPRGHDTGRIITTKTAFGSTSDMVIDPSKYLLNDEPVNLAENEVICQDDTGFYLTLKNRIDNSTADPNRYANHKNRLDLKEKENSST